MLALASFGGIGCRNAFLLLNLIKLGGTWLVVLNVPKTHLKTLTAMSSKIMTRLLKNYILQPYHQTDRGIYSYS